MRHLTYRQIMYWDVFRCANRLQQGLAIFYPPCNLYHKIFDDGGVVTDLFSKLFFQFSLFLGAIPVLQNSFSPFRFLSTIFLFNPKLLDFCSILLDCSIIAWFFHCFIRYRFVSWSSNCFIGESTGYFHFCKTGDSPSCRKPNCRNGRLPSCRNHLWTKSDLPKCFKSIEIRN